MTETQILGPDGKPARQAVSSSPSGRCPRCGATKNKRVRGSGFGVPVAVPICGVCGFEFKGEEMDE